MGKHTIYVTGHKNPDSDSIISAMAYAYFKQQMGCDAIAVRLGEINKETEYILNLFNEFAPPLVRDIKTCIRDIDFDDVVTCKITDNLYTAMNIMRERNKKVIAVVDDHKHLLGMATMSDITSPTIPHQDTNNRLIRETPIEDIAELLHAKLVYKAEVQHTDGHVFIAASVDDVGAKDKIVITANDEAIQKAAINEGAATLIASHDKKFTREIKKLAKEKNCNLLVCNDKIYDISKKIYFAASVDKVMSSNLTCFRYDEYIDDIKPIMNKSRFRSYPVLDTRKHIIGTISRYHVFKHTNRNLILVDHNELAQSIEGVENANVMEVIDHHRIGGSLKTSSPVFFRNEQVGCCATIITKIFLENQMPIPDDLAGLLCCAIISDTINFKSVTCTQQDIDYANYLAEMAHLNLKELGPKILAAGANLSDKSCYEIFHADLKKFEINKNKIVVAQSNVVSLESIMPFKLEMEKLLEDFSTDSDSGIVMMCFTLIDGTGSYVLAKGKGAAKLDDVLDKYGRYEQGFFFLPGFVSRKLQLIPMITEGLS